MVQTRRAGVLVTAITLALAVAGCNGAAMKVLPLKVAPGIGAVDHSWSWGVVPGTADAEPLVVGIDRRGGGPATLQIGTVALDRFFRAPTLPSLPGSPLAVQALRKGAGAVIVGGLLDDLGQPKVFVLTSDDGKAWRPLATNPEVDVIPDAATVLDGAVLLTGGRALHRVAEDGTTSALAMPSLEDIESVAGLASRRNDAWLLTTGGGSTPPRLFASSDAGATWGTGTPVTLVETPNFTPTGILADNDRLYLTGSCAPRVGEGHACLVVGDGTAWAVETPFGVAGPATSMLPPARGDDGSLLVAVTMPAFSEGWLAQRRQGGQWIGSRGDVVGDEPGDVVALGAGSRGEGLVAVTTSTATTSLVTRARADADAGADRRNVLGGPGVSSWVRSVGVGLSPSSQFLEVRPTVVKAATGGYLVLKKERPVTMTDTSLEPEEWRPAQLRGMDASLGESAGGVSVLVGSDPAKTLEDLGEVRVFATNPDGTWDRVATDLAARFEGQMAMAMTHTGGMWLVATAAPILSIAKDAARLFGSDDGRTWVELPAPEAAGSANRISALCGSNGDMVLALGTEAGPAKDGGWVRSAGTWHDLVVPAGLSPQRCAGTPVAVVVIGGDDGADRIWRLEGQGLVEVDADLPPRADLRDVVPIGGGVGVVGFVESRGVRAVSVWFSRDLERWSQTRLDAVAGDAYVTAAASGDELVVVATSSDGVRAWRVRKPW